MLATPPCATSARRELGQDTRSWEGDGDGTWHSPCGPQLQQHRTRQHRCREQGGCTREETETCVTTGGSGARTITPSRPALSSRPPRTWSTKRISHKCERETLTAVHASTTDMSPRTFHEASGTHEEVVRAQPRADVDDHQVASGSPHLDRQAAWLCSAQRQPRAARQESVCKC